MRKASIPSKVFLLAFTAMLLASCAAVYDYGTSSSFSVTGIRAEERSNGYIFKIEAIRKIGRIEAWIGPDNWLYVSIPDTSVDTTEVADLSGCPVVSQMHLFRYPGSFQLSLKLNQKFDHVGVLRYPGDFNVYVVLYVFKQGS